MRDRAVAFVARRTGLSSTELPQSSRAIRAAARRLADRLSAGASSTEARSAAMSLHAAIWAPLQPALARVNRVLIIPDGELAEIPFAALLDGRTERHLIEDHEVVAAPSATSVIEALERAPETWQPLLAVGAGSVDSSAGLPLLPGADIEAQEVAALHVGSRLLRGEGASKQALLAALPTYVVVHFAGHSVIDPLFPERSHLVLAGREGDQTVTPTELAAHGMNAARLVVLSSCSSVAGSPSRVAPLGGFAASLMAAGVPRLLGTAWPVDDRDARAFLVRFHRHLIAGRSPASSLRTAQLEAIKSPDPYTASPSFWAAYQLVGVP
jgi:CHAT domain-containing protein